MASRQVVYGVGAAATGGILYYLYSAGGDPKLAEKKAEYDAATLRAKMSGSASARGTQAQKGIEESAQSLGSGVNYAIEQAKNEGKYYSGKVQDFSKDVEKNVNKAIEEAKARGQNWQGELQHYKEDAEKKAQQAIEQAKAQAQDLTKNFTSYEADAERKLEQARKETGSKLTKAVDDFDRTVEATASKAKSSMFGWFGNSK